MALIFNVTHTVTFGTLTGEDYQWELDILRSYDDQGSTPSWVNDPTVQVTATNSPISIQWMQNTNIYKPISGSKATINLMELEGTNLPSFTSAGQFEYQVRLRYRRNGESTLNDYWTGFVQALEGNKAITAGSKAMSFTATDGLGGLGDTRLDIDLDNIADINLFNKITKSIYQTGLDLDIYVDSGIRNSLGDALLTATAHPYAFDKGETDNPELRKISTRKEAIEGVLSAFNCRIIQSDGRWYIYNSSTHSNTPTWSKYHVVNGEYVYDTDVTESLSYRLGSGSADLLIAGDDLELSTRLPFGSVECRPKNVKAKNFITNGLLGNGNSGFQVNSNSADQTINRTNTTTDHPTADFAFQTYRSRYDLGETNDIWFETIDMPVDVNAPIDVAFDWLVNGRSNQDVYLGWAAELTTDNVVSTTGNYRNSAQDGSYYDSVNESTFVYNWYRNEWDSRISKFNDNTRPASTTAGLRSENCNVVSEWKEVRETLNVGEYYEPVDGQHVELDGTLKLTFFYLQSKTPSRKRWQGNSTSNVSAQVTNFSVKNKYRKNVTNPVFERLQADYTETHKYSPMFADALPEATYQRILQEGFWRSNETSSDSTTLERIVTQQKLNDYRNEFKYYEGNFINIGSDPISPINTINLDWNNYSETEDLIISGGTFRPKEGRFDISAYVPNQGTDVAPQDGSINSDGTATPGFYSRDVDLVAGDFQGRSSMVKYHLAIDPIGIDEFDVALTTNPLTVDQYTNGVLTLTGKPGEVFPVTCTINVADNFEAAASNMSFFDGTNANGIWSLFELGEDTAENLSNIVFTDKGRELELSFDVEMPNLSEFEILHIRGEVDPLLASNRNFDITFDLDASVTDASIVNDTRDLRGIPGTTANVACIITPSADKQLDASSFTATVGTGITLTGFEQMGTSVYAEFEVTFQEDDTTITVDIDGDAAVNVPSDVETSTVTLTLSESIGNVSISRTNLTLTGIVGTTAIYDVIAYAADGFELTASNFSVTESESWLVMSNAVGGGENVSIPLEITFPQADASGSATISGSAQATGSSTVSITLNFTNNVSDSSLTDTSESFILNPGQRINYTNTLTPSRGRFMNASDLTITESSSVVAFSASDAGGGSVNMSTSVTAPSSNATIPVTLSGSVSEEPYVATINLTEELPQGMVKQNTLSQRFGATDSNVVFSVTVTPTEGRTEYASGTTFTIVNGTGSNYTYANGEVTFDLTVSLPTFSSSFPIGNVSIGSSITGIAPSYTGDYGLVPASNMVQWSQGGSTTTATVNFGVVSTPVPGRWTVQSSSTGITSATISSDASSLTVVRPRTAGTYNGLPFFSTPTGSVTLVHQDDSSVTATITIVHNIPTLANDANNVYSNGLESIDVNIGGSAGSTAGVLYIT